MNHFLHYWYSDPTIISCRMALVMRGITFIINCSIAKLEKNCSSFLVRPSHYRFLYRPLKRIWRGGGEVILVSPCQSVCLWRTESCPLFIFHNTNWIHFICTCLVNKLQKVWRVFSFLKNYKIRIFGNFFKFVTLTLSCVHAMWRLKLIPHLSFYCSHLFHDVYLT